MSNKPVAPRAPLIRALEPRLLFDGAAVGTAMDTATDQSLPDDHGGSDSVHAASTTAEAQAQLQSPMVRAFEASQNARAAEASASPQVSTPAKPITVKEDAPVNISGLSVSGEDDTDYSLTLGVENGTLTFGDNPPGTITGDGSGSVTINGSADEINTALGSLSYKGNQDFNGSDTLSIGDETVAINVTADNDAPSFDPTMTLDVDEGGNASFSASDFGVTDPDLTTGADKQTEAQEVIQIESLPSQGKLTLDGNPIVVGSTFSMEQIENLVYNHDGTDVQEGDSDSFSVVVNDGGDKSEETTISVDLNPVNQAPELTGSLTPKVYEGQGAEPNNDGTNGIALGLGYADFDESDTADNATFTISEIALQDQGTLYFEGGDAVEAEKSYDVARLGDLRFDHNGQEPSDTPPQFAITLTDNGGGTDDSKSTTETVSIDVLPNDDDPVLETNAGTEVDAGNTVELTDEMLASTDTDSDESFYAITERPEYGELQIQDGAGAWQTLGVGATVTQTDLNNGRVRYVQSVNVNADTSDGFNFQVYDGELKAFNDAGDPGAVRDDNGAIATNRFEIAIIGANTGGGEKPDDPDPEYSGGLEVTDENNLGFDDTPAEGDNTPGGNDTKIITSDDLSYVLSTTGNAPRDIAASQTFYRLTSLPDNGILQKSDGEGNWRTLSGYQSFTQADIDNGNIHYVHDGSENHQSSFDFSVSGGTSEVVNGTFDISVAPTNDRPTATGGTSEPFGEGDTIRLGSDLIGMDDIDNANEDGEPTGEASPDDLFFRITSQPEHGTLERLTSDGSWEEIDFDGDDGNSGWLSQQLLSADDGESGIRYTHDGSENFSDDFTFDVRDDLDGADPYTVRDDALLDDSDLLDYQRALSDVATVSLSVAPINDAPITPAGPDGDDVTIIDENGAEQTTTNDGLHLAEGGTETITSDMLKTVDPDSDAGVLQYRVTSDVEHGTLMLNGRALGEGSRFTQADIDAGDVTYEHGGSEAFEDSFKFIVSDSVDDHGYAEGDSDSGASTFEIVVDASRNDTPEIANNGDSTVDLFGDADGSNYTHDFGDAFAIADADIDDGNIDTDAGEQDFIQAQLAFRDAEGNLVDITADGGSIDFGSTSGLTLVDNDASDGTLVIQGSYADVQAALTGLSVTVPKTDYNDTYSLDVSVDDRLRDESGELTDGANGNSVPPTNDAGQPLNDDGTVINETNNVATTSVTFRVSDDNDAPTFKETPGDQTVAEDEVLDLSGYQIDDVDAFDSELSVTLAVGDNGHLSVAGDATTSNSNTLELSGTVDEINDQLAGLSYKADGDYHGSDELTITVNDNGSNGSGGASDVTNTTAITVTPVNDTPSVDVPGTQTLDQDQIVTFSGDNAITVDDPSDYDYLGGSAVDETVNDQMQVTIEAALEDGVSGSLGSLNLGATDDITFVDDTNDGDSQLVIQGTRAALNAALAGLTYDLGDSNNSDRTDTISVTLNDMADGGSEIDGTGNAGANDVLTATGTIAVQISGVNDGPSVSLPGSSDPYTVDEDSSDNQLSGISVSDPDDFGEGMKVTVGVEYGSLAVDGIEGLDVSTSGDGRTLTLKGSEGQLNDALDTLTYTPDADFHTSGDEVDGDTLSVTINDLGNTGTGGAKTDTATTTIDITPINDQPDATGGPESLEGVDEDTDGGVGQTFSDLLSDNYDDSTDDQIDGSGGDTATDLSYIAIVGNAASADQGTWQVSDGDGGWVDIPADDLSASSALVVTADTNVRFNPADDFFGEPGALSVRLADGDKLTSSDDISASTVNEGSVSTSNLDDNGGTGETGRWSAESVGLNIAVANVNDRPAGGDAELEAINEGNLDADGATVADLFGDGYSDALDDQSDITNGGNNATDLGGIAIIGNAATADQGTWQYSTDDGENWSNLATDVSDENATTLAADTRLRFVPANGDYNDDSTQDAPGELTVRLADSGQSAATAQDISGSLGQTDTWSETVALETSVKPVNDAPSADVSEPGDIEITEGNTFDKTGFMDGILPDADVENGASDENDQTVSFNVKDISTSGKFTIEELFGDNAPAFVDGENSGADNRLTFIPSDILAKGETQTVTVTVDVKDSGGTANGGSDTGESRTFTITLTGTNDAPTSTNDLPPLTDNDGAEITPVATADQFDDLDTNNTLTYSTGVDGTNTLPPGLSIDPETGEISGTLDDSASQGGPNGDGVYSVTVTATDNAGATATSTFTWTVSNLAPTATDNANSIAEDAATPTTGNVITDDDGNGIDSDPEDPASQLVVSAVEHDGSPGTLGDALSGEYGAITVNADGSYSYAIDNTNAAVQALAVGETLTDSFDYTVADQEGGTDTATLTVTVTGTNDVPVANADTNSTDENTPTSGNVLPNDTDTDATDTLTVSEVNGDPDGVGNGVTGDKGGQFTIGEDGSYTFEPGNDFDELAAGETRDTQVTYQVDDGHGGTDTATLTVTVTGTNDVPTSTDDLPNLTNDDGDEIALVPTAGQFSDIDTSNTLTYDVGGLPEGVTINETTGEISGTLDDSASQGGPNGDGVYSVTVTATDDEGTTATSTFTWTVSNLAPTATDNSSTIAEDATVPTTGNVIDDDNDNGVDSDPEDPADQLIVAALDGDDANVGESVTGQYGAITVNEDGSYSYAIDNSNADVQALAVGETLTDSFDYTVADQEGGTDTATLTITVTGTNDVPVANADTNSTDENTPTSGNVLPNDTDADATDTLTVSEVNGDPDGVGNGVTGDKGGQFTIGEDGSYDFEPGSDFDELAAGETRDTQVTYQVDDGHAGTDTATLTVTVTGTNDVPTSTDDLPNLTNDDGDEIALVPTAGQFSDIDTSNTLTYDVGGLPEGVTINETTGEISGTLDDSASQGGPNGDGVYSVTVTATDDEGTTATSTFTWTVSNLAPTATDNSSTIAEDATVPTTGNVIDDDNDNGVDSDPEDPADQLIVAALDGDDANVGESVTGQYGAITVNEDGSYSYAIDNSNADVQALAVGETLNESFAYTVSDQEGGTDTATLTITVTGTNDAPTSTNDLPPLTDNDGAEITPVATADQFDDLDTNNTLTYSTGVDGTNTLPPGLSIDPETGEISGTLDDSASQGGPNGDGVYSVTVTATDNAGATATSTFTWTVSNLAPTATDNANSIAEDAATPTTGNVITDDDGNGIDSDPEDPASQLVVSAVEHDGSPGKLGDALSGEYGSVTVNADGSYSYAVDNSNADVQALAVGETLSDTFSYQVSDGEGGTDTSTLTVTINGTNDIPVANADTNTTDENTPTSGNVLPNDTDTDATDTLTVSEVNGDPDGVGNGVTGDKGGQFTIGEDGSYTFEPGNDFDELAAGETRDTQVTYQVDDGHGGTDTATLTVTVNGVNDAPTSTGLGDQTNDDGESISVDTASAFSDADTSDTLEYSATNLPPGLSIDATTGKISGDIDFDASTGGPYSVTVTATDFDDDGNATGTSVDAQFEWTVNNPVPVAANDTDSTDEDTSINRDAANGVIDPNDNDTAPDGDDLSVDQVDNGMTTAGAGTAISGDEGGQFTINADGSYDFDPNSDFEDLAVGESATTSVTYRITDGEGGTDTATLTITVTGTNDVPVANADTNSTDENTPTSGNVLPNDTDADATDTLTVSEVNGDPDGVGNGVTGDKGGQFTIGEDGSYDFEPGSDFDELAAGETRDTQVTYQVDDGHAGTDTATLTVTVTGTNDVPTSTDDLPNLTNDDGDEIAPVATAGQFSDIDTSNTLTYDVGGLPEGLTINETTGEITGTLDDSASQGGPNGDGMYSVTVTATDDEGATATSTFTWTVGNLAPTATDNSSTIAEDANAPTIGNVIDDDNGNGVDSDPEDPADQLIVAALDGDDANVGEQITGTYGAITVNEDGSYSYVIDNSNADVQALAVGETLNESFAYTVSDQEGGTETATLTITISGTNDVPVVDGDGTPDQSVTDGDIVSIPVGDGFSDLDRSDELTFSGTITDGNGDSVDPTDIGLSLDPKTGEISGKIGAGASSGGPYSITVTANDGNGGSASQTFTLDVDPIPTPPIDTSVSLVQPSAPAGLSPAFLGVFESDSPASNFDSGAPDYFVSDPLNFRGFGEVGFTSPNPQILRYQGTQTDGSPLPGTLTVDASNGELSGRLPPGMERAKITVISVDEYGNTRTREVDVDADGQIVRESSPAESGNDAVPYRRVSVSAGDGNATRVLKVEEGGNDMRFSEVQLQGSRLQVAVEDPQEDSVTSYEATLADGSPLPPGLSIDSMTGDISGKIPEGLSSLSIRIVAVGNDGNMRVLTLNLDQGAQTRDAAWQSLDAQAAKALAGINEYPGATSIGENLARALRI